MTGRSKDDKIITNSLQYYDHPASRISWAAKPQVTAGKQSKMAQAPSLAHHSQLCTLSRGLQAGYIMTKSVSGQANPMKTDRKLDSSKMNLTVVVCQ